MIAIQLFDGDGRRGLSLRQFEANVLGLCEAHRRAGRACLFALLLHGPESPQFSKALSDRDYWVALDAISGRALTVFAVFNGLLREASDISVRQYSDRLRTASSVIRSVLDAHFDVDQVTFPSILFFQVVNSKVSDQRLVLLQARSIEDAYAEVASVLNCAAAALKDSDGNLIADASKAFERVSGVLRASAMRSVAARVYDAGLAVRDWLGLFLG